MAIQHQAVVSSAEAAMGGGAGQFPSTSLYVGDLELGVSDAQLYDVFSQIGQVVSVRVCRDITSRRSLGYAYVNFSDPADGLSSDSIIHDKLKIEISERILDDAILRPLPFVDVQFDAWAIAAKAIEILNFTPLNGKAIRLMYSNRDPNMRRSGAANIFIKNLDKTIDNKALYDTFSVFGSILSCKVALDASGLSKGYGFVHFEQEEAAQNAIEKLNGMLMNDKKVFVGPFVRKQEREGAATTVKFNNVFVKNLSESVTDETLQEVFGEFGKITSCIVMREGDGRSKCFGFVNFENPDDAAMAVQELNGKKFDDKEWYVGKAQKKSEREQELKERFEQSKQEDSEKFQGVNLYLKNLDDSIGDGSLRELFSGFGTITSCKVMLDKNGVSKGSGFVAFQSSEDALRAVSEMNGKMVGSKPLYVALAQRKEDRRARLQAQFSQTRPVAMQASVAPRVPLYPPGAPGLGQPLFYGQPPPALVPQACVSHVFLAGGRGVAEQQFQNLVVALWNCEVVIVNALGFVEANCVQLTVCCVVATAVESSVSAMHPPDNVSRVAGAQVPGFGFQQPLVPGMRPGGAPFPNFFMPMVQPGQQVQRPGGRRGASGAAHQNQQHPMPMIQQQVAANFMLSRGGRPYRYPAGRNVQDVSGMAGGLFPYDMGGMPVRDAAVSHPIPIGELASALTNATPEHQRTLLGESLYPLVEQLEPEYAAKVTGMLLEMDQTEVLHLLESPEALNAKVAEALEVLRSVAQHQQQAVSPVDRLAALSLNDVVS
ncbi:hypothetical protein ZIOFF_020883 [Zingiber officinale]|uniref:Polyadenylate-binding protein n=1 Tax=Zingiber officinale TaxID=94328 RepID=A0A8J5HJ65_ZINOF|nr:hypothetical protein ZIOFF_020883 [Zingiber officinale]